MQNPGFETGITGPPDYAFYSVYQHRVRDAATSTVPHWIRTDPSVTPVVLHGPQIVFGHPETPIEGSSYAGMEGVAQPQGLVGELTHATVVGAKYVLSAETMMGGAPMVLPLPVVFTLQLRNSATGAQSAPIEQQGVSQDDWMLVSGTVTAAAGYDQVVLQWAEQQGFGLVDDVHLCQIAAAPHPPGWLTLPHGLAVAFGVLLVGGIGVGLVLRRRTT